MAEGRDCAKPKCPWLELFRCFQVTLDPRKLIAAAAGILVTSVGWYLLSSLFYTKAPERSEAQYSNATLMKEYEGKKEEEIVEIGNRMYQRDLEQWKQLADLAAPASTGKAATDKTPAEAPTPAGRLRTLPWDEYRGPNPFLLATDVIGGSAAERSDSIGGFISGSIPVLIEPLMKMLLPVTKIVSPGVSPLTRFYLFLVLLWGLVVWGFFGGIITRLAAVQLANKGPVSFRATIRFVAKRYLNYLLAPLTPLAIIAAIALGLIIFGTVALIPVLGDLVFFGLGLPLIILGGAIMAVFLVGLVGYPLMYPTLSVEGDSSDTFDALSRSINYVYQAPWQYIWYWIVATLYGAAVTFFVLFFASLMVYAGKWAVGLPASAMYSDRKPEFLFIYAPESFGWKELLLKDSPYEVKPVTLKTEGRRANIYVPANPEADAAQRSQYYGYNTLGARMVGLWLGVLFLAMLGFSYSFFWTAATVIYYLLRKKIDEAEMDEVYLEEDEPEAPPAPPKPAAAAPLSPPPPATTTPLTVIQPPPPPALPPPPPPPIPLAGDTKPT